jgi:hypothetical protein
MQKRIRNILVLIAIMFNSFCTIRNKAQKVSSSSSVLILVSYRMCSNCLRELNTFFKSTNLVKRNIKLYYLFDSTFSCSNAVNYFINNRNLDGLNYASILVDSRSVDSSIFYKYQIRTTPAVLLIRNNDTILVKEGSLFTQHGVLRPNVMKSALKKQME